MIKAESRETGKDESNLILGGSQRAAFREEKPRELKRRKMTVVA